MKKSRLSCVQIRANKFSAYLPSTRQYRGLPELNYPFHDREIIVASCGRLCLHRKKISISKVLAVQHLGIKEVEDGLNGAQSHLTAYKLHAL
ncbi:MAG: hypothetical protein AAGD92_06680 [Pseudomonadota bacterium]